MTLVSIRTPSKHKVAAWSALTDRAPIHAVVGEVDLVITRYDDQVSVLYGRCAHRRALMADGHDHLGKFVPGDLTTFDREMAHLSGVRYGGVGL